MFTIACCLVVGLESGLGIDLISGRLMVMHTSFHVAHVVSRRPNILGQRSGYKLFKQRSITNVGTSFFFVKKVINVWNNPS